MRGIIHFSLKKKKHTKITRIFKYLSIRDLRLVVKTCNFSSEYHTLWYLWHVVKFSGRWAHTVRVMGELLGRRFENQNECASSFRNAVVDDLVLEYCHCHHLYYHEMSRNTGGFFPGKTRDGSTGVIRRGGGKWRYGYRWQQHKPQFWNCEKRFGFGWKFEWRFNDDEISQVRQEQYSIKCRVWKTCKRG